MPRILFEWHGIRIYSYPAFLYLGLVFGVVAENHAAHVAGLDSARVFLATLVLIIPALVGARFLYVAAHWRDYRREPRRIWRQSEGGAAMLGAIPVMLLAAVPVLAAFELPFGAFWDVATFCILTGMIFTRIGCLLNGCCGGRPSEGFWAIPLPDHRGIWERRIPSQLLEAGWAALLLAGAAIVWHAMPFPGALFLTALAGYAGGRIVLEATRQNRQTLGPVDLQQALAAICAGSALACLVLLRP
jgi:phosphatidylglycerol:prolipoprotein diacylglycerol transferase